MASVISGVSDLAVRIPELWSPLMYDQLRSSLLMGSYFSRAYEGVIRNVGDVVKVQQFTAPTGETLTNDETSFSSEAIVLNDFSVTVDKRASAAFEITDLAQLQSLPFAAQAQEALIYSVQKRIENAIIAALVPSAAAPDHDIAPVVPSDMGAEDLIAAKRLLDAQYVPMQGRVAFLSPSYYNDLLSKQLVVSRDYTASNSIQSGVVDQLVGFTIVAHNGLADDTAFFCHSSALQMVMQQDLRVKISDQHSSLKYQYVISADLVFGMSLFDNKRIVKITG